MLKGKFLMFEIKETDSKITPAKKVINLKNIAVKHLKFVDIETGEDNTESVIAEIPKGIESVNFKLTFEIPDSE